MNHFFWGALAMASWVAGLFFVRFWWSTRDRLFAYFGVAFWVLMLGWIAVAVVPAEEESRHHVFWFRLVAFALIAIGIVDKNRSERRSVTSSPPSAPNGGANERP